MREPVDLRRPGHPGKSPTAMQALHCRLRRLTCVLTGTSSFPLPHRFLFACIITVLIREGKQGSFLPKNPKGLSLNLPLPNEAFQERPPAQAKKRISPQGEVLFIVRFEAGSSSCRLASGLPGISPYGKTSRQGASAMRVDRAFKAIL